MKLVGKSVIITGGSRGIGKAVAKLFKQEGANIMITSKNLEKLKNTANEIGGISFMQADIRNQQQVNDVVKKTINTFDKIDVLINNAGIFPKMKPLEDISESEWNEVIDINLNGQVRFTKAIIPFMKKHGGVIINVASNNGLKAFKNFQADAYTASKGALVLLTKAWAIEYAKFKIRVNCVCPGVVETDMSIPYLSTKEDREFENAAYPLGRIGQPEEVAKAILYFASDDASWITGSVLAIDGGESAT